jgi:hypothetical protein
VLREFKEILARSQVTLLEDTAGLLSLVAVLVVGMNLTNLI